MNLFNLVHQLNSVGVNKINNNNNNHIIVSPTTKTPLNLNNNNNHIIVNEKNGPSQYIDNDPAVIPKETGESKSGLVMVTYPHNGKPLTSSSTATLKKLSNGVGSFLFSSSTLPMRIEVTSDHLTLLSDPGAVTSFIGDEVDEGLSLCDNSGLPINHYSSLGSAATLRKPANIDEFRTVKLVREKSVGFGLSVKGGCEHGLPILISGLTKDGPADRSRQLFIGDAIVRIDEITLSLTTTTHEEAIKLLKQAGVEVNLTVKHFKMVTPFLAKCWKKKISLSEDEAGNLMVTNGNINHNNNSEKGSKPEGGKQLIASSVSSKRVLTTEACQPGKHHSLENRRPSKIITNNNIIIAINNNNNDNGANEKGKTGKNENDDSTEVKSCKEIDIPSKWIPLISIDLATCFVTKYIHDSDKIRPHGFEIRWLTQKAESRLASSTSAATTTASTTLSSCCPSTSSSSTSTTSSLASSTSSSTSSTSSLSSPKSTDSGVAVGSRSNINSHPCPGSNSLPVDTSTIKRNQVGPTRIYSSAIVICDNQSVYREWFSNIDQHCKKVTFKQMQMINRHLPRSEKILFMGWINQGLPSSSTSLEPHRPCYHWYTRYLVIKGGDALIYIKPPQGLLESSNSNEIDSSKKPANGATSTTNTSTETTTNNPNTTSTFSSHPLNIRWSEGQPYLFKAHQSVLRCLKANEFVDERENCFLLLSCDTNYSSGSPSSLLLSASSSSSSSTSTTSTITGSVKAPLFSKPETTSTITSSDRYHETTKSNSTDNSIENTTTAPIETTAFYLSVETPSELAVIRNNWNRATYQSVTQLGSKSFAVTCCGRSGTLTLDWRLGFTFNQGNERTPLWSFKFSQLKKSSDDGQTILWLTFHPATVTTAKSVSTMQAATSSSLTPSSSPSSSSSSLISSRPDGITCSTSTNERGRFRSSSNGTFSSSSNVQQSSETLLSHSSTSSITYDSSNQHDSINGQRNHHHLSSSTTSSTHSSSVGPLLSSSRRNPNPNQPHHSHYHQKPSNETNPRDSTIQIETNQLELLLHSIHAFLTAKVISVDQSFLNSC